MVLRREKDGLVLIYHLVDEKPLRVPSVDAKEMLKGGVACLPGDERCPEDAITTAKQKFMRERITGKPRIDVIKTMSTPELEDFCAHHNVQVDLEEYESLADKREAVIGRAITDKLITDNQ